MKQFISLVVKETRHILRDRRTMLILFGMPTVMMLLFGFAISTDVKDVRTVIVVSQMNARTQAAVARLEASEHFVVTHTAATPAEAERLIRQQRADMAIVFDADYGNGRGGAQLIADGADPNMAQQWTAYAIQTLAAQPTQPVNSKMLYNPQMKSAYNFVPAIMGMLLMLICAMMTSISIVREKERGTMELLLASPVRPLLVILAKAVPYLLLALVILAVILLMARYVLGVPLAGSLFWIVAVAVIYIFMALSLGLLISNIVRTQLAALLASAMLLLMPVVMLSGMLFPIESMPTVLQWVAAAMPPRYFVDAMRKLMIMGVGVGQVAKEVAILSGMTLLFLTIALAKFKRRLE